MINVWNFLFLDRCLFLFYWFTDHVLQFHLQDQAFFIFGFLFNDSWILQNSIQSCIWCSGYLSWITVELGFQSHLCPFGILQDLLCRKAYPSRDKFEVSCILSERFNFSNHEFCLPRDERRYWKWISRIYCWATCSGKFVCGCIHWCHISDLCV